MEFVAKDVAKLLNKPVAHIAQIGQVIQPHTPARGRGRRSLYSFKNMVEIAVYDYLNTFGVPRKMIKVHLESLNQSRYRWLEEDGEDGWAVLDEEWRWSAGSTPNHSIVNLNQSGEVKAIIAVDLGLIKENLRRQLNMEVRNG